MCVCDWLLNVVCPNRILPSLKTRTIVKDKLNRQWNHYIGLQPKWKTRGSNSFCAVRVENKINHIFWSVWSIIGSLSFFINKTRAPANTKYKENVFFASRYLFFLFLFRVYNAFNDQLPLQYLSKAILKSVTHFFTSLTRSLSGGRPLLSTFKVRCGVSELFTAFSTYTVPAAPFSKSPFPPAASRTPSKNPPW